MASSIEADVAAADAFWVDSPKALSGPPPEFGDSKFYREGAYAREAIWPIADSLGIVTGGQLRFVVRPGLGKGPSVSVIFNRQAIARLDFVQPHACETNPLWGADLGLPARVCGSHFHDWRHNRANVLSLEQWELPCREPLPPQVRRFDQAFPWLAARINLILTPDQRNFDIPMELL